MILRYRDTDFRTYKEDEIICTGSKLDIEKYILANYSIDWLVDDIESKSEKTAELNRLSIGCAKCPMLFTDDVLKDNFENGKDIDDKCDWENVIASQYTFNVDVLEIL